MTSDTAKQIGRIKAIIALVVAMAILEFSWFFSEAGGNWANGLIFFIDAQMNPEVLIFFILLFGITYFLGGKAAAGILERPEKYLAAGTKYGLLTSLIVILYWTIVYILHNGFHVTFYQIMLVLPALLLIVTITSGWLWAAWQIMRKVKHTDL
ncbi:hypothetical protein [Chitinophaga sp.]|uniref:hypothetical protein n=1 Tax=Chitinophaga sp. TaxID=1869181 RepID=UPI002F923269